MTVRVGKREPPFAHDYIQKYFSASSLSSYSFDSSEASERLNYRFQCSTSPNIIVKYESEMPHLRTPILISLLLHFHSSAWQVCCWKTETKTAPWCLFTECHFHHHQLPITELLLFHFYSGTWIWRRRGMPSKVCHYFIKLKKKSWLSR